MRKKWESSDVRGWILTHLTIGNREEYVRRVGCSSDTLDRLVTGETQKPKSSNDLFRMLHHANVPLHQIEQAILDLYGEKVSAVEELKAARLHYLLRKHSKVMKMLYLEKSREEIEKSCGEEAKAVLDELTELELLKSTDKGLYLQDVSWTSVNSDLRLGGIIALEVEDLVLAKRYAIGLGRVAAQIVAVSDKQAEDLSDLEHEVYERRAAILARKDPGPKTMCAYLLSYAAFERG